jgi:predicted glutamine amidotransferase
MTEKRVVMQDELARSLTRRAGSRRPGAWIAAALCVAGLCAAMLLSQPGRASEGARGAGDEPETHNCRLWALIGHDYPDTLLRDHLQTGTISNLRQQGHWNRDGWGFAYAPNPALGLPISGLLYRRGGPPADYAYEPQYDLAVQEMKAIRPPAIVGHVRTGTSGHFGLPDPHPFIQPRPSERAMAFAHNGGVDEAAMLTLLGDYIDAHPLDYTTGLPGSGPVDSELFFLYLLKYKDEHPELASFSESIPPAVREVIRVTQSTALNVTMTQGDTLYAIASFPLSYFPLSISDGDEASPYWVVASQIVGSTAEGWETIPQMTLGVFAPDAAPHFIPIGITASENAPRSPAAPDAPSREVPAAPDAPAADRAIADAPDHNCRMWALVGWDYPAGLIEDHLSTGTIQNLKALGGANHDGWGIGYFPFEWRDLPFTNPIVRRGGPPANSPCAPFFDRTVNDMRLLRPQAAIGHVRLGTSGHLGVPDPHPFVRPHPRRAPGTAPGLMFAHNGSLDALKLGQRLGRSYLETHPPDYGTMTELDVQHIDSELYYIYLLKLVEERPQLPFAEALLEAVRAISMDDEVTEFNPRLNFVMTDGDTLYAMNYYGETNSKPLYFYPEAARNDPPIQPAFWVVASEPLGSVPGWSVMPARTLAVFVPGESPRMLALDASPDPVFTLDDVEVFPQIDADCDGWVSSFAVCCDPNVNAGAWQVSVSLLAAPAGTDDWSTLVTTRATTIEGAAGDSICVTGFVDPPSLRASAWDLKLLLTEYSSGDTIAVATDATHPGLGLDGLGVEGAQRDTIPDPPPSFSLDAITVGDAIDRDDDGYARSFVIGWDANVQAVGCGLARADSAFVRLRIFATAAGDSFQVGQSDAYWIHDAEEELSGVAITVADTVSAQMWDLHLALLDATGDTLLIAAGPAAYPALGGIRVEGASRDTLLAPPDTLNLEIDPPQPNPTAGEVRITLRIPRAGATASLEVWDVMGRRIWKAPAAALAEGEHQLVWPGVDARGVRVPAGAYFCRARVNGRDWEWRISLVR